MYRDSDGPGLVGDGTGDGLSDPPCGIGRELEASVIIEFFYGSDEADVAFLKKVEKRHAASDMFLGYADDQSKIGFDEMFLSFFSFLEDLFEIFTENDLAGFEEINEFLFGDLIF